MPVRLGFQVLTHRGDIRRSLGCGGTLVKAEDVTLQEPEGGNQRWDWDKGLGPAYRPLPITHLPGSRRGEHILPEGGGRTGL